jgi:endonuclease/exonuclease/phosphatase family metal-dependent hydrolase
MLSVPVILVANFFFVFVYLASRSWKFILSLLVLVISYPLLQRTFNYSQNEKSLSEKQFSVLSFNVMYLNKSAFKSGRDKESPIKLAKAIDSLEADIKCFQELYVDKKPSQFDLLNKLKRKNKYSVFMQKKVFGKDYSGTVGLAIFSKYPVIDTEEILWLPNNNGILRADIVIGNDTLRVLNVQLKSMGIRVKKVLNANDEERAEETKNVLLLLKKGFEDRSSQVNKIEELISKSPYPVIVCGDFNELPYGYAYGRIRKQLNNAFESAGKGFGFTYNKILSFLRIDNQFYDEKRINVISFKTYSEIPWSDHFPIKGEFEFK